MSAKTAAIKPVNDYIEQDLFKNLCIYKSRRWKMQEFFAGSGLVATGLKDYFNVVWANDICPNKAAIYAANNNSPTEIKKE